MPTANFGIPYVTQSTKITASDVNAILDKIDAEMHKIIIYEKLVKSFCIPASSNVGISVPSDWDFCKMILPPRTSYYNSSGSNGYYGTTQGEVKITKQQWEQETTQLYLAVGDFTQRITLHYANNSYLIEFYNSYNQSGTLPINIEFYKLVNQI